MHFFQHEDKTIALQSVVRALLSCVVSETGWCRPGLVETGWCRLGLVLSLSSHL